MNGDSATAIAEQKALLRARAELDRTRLAFALHQILAVVVPERELEPEERRRPALSTVLAVLASIFGPRKVARWVRVASWALTAFRFVRNWRRMR